MVKMSSGLSMEDLEGDGIGSLSCHKATALARPFRIRVIDQSFNGIVFASQVVYLCFASLCMQRTPAVACVSTRQQIAIN